MTTQYRDTGAIGRDALRDLAGKYLAEHPGVSNADAAGALAVAYPGHEAGQLRAVITAALAEARLAGTGGAR